VNISFDANGYALVTSDQGICRYDKSKKWTSIIGNLQLNQFYTITPDPKDTNRVYGVGQDDYSALKADGSVQWHFMWGSTGEFGKVLVDPGNPDLLYANNPLDIDNFVRRSTDAGDTWTTIISSIWRKKEDYDLAALTQKSFVMDPSNPSRLLLGTVRIYETTNASSNNPDWTAISNILSPSNSINKQYIRTLAIAPSNGKTIYAATNDGHLWATFNGGINWNSYDNGLFGVADGPVVGISINPLTSMQGFAITSRAGSNNIWRFQIMMIGSPNNFSLYPVWSNISFNFPTNLRPYSIAIDWNNQIPILYIGTDRGVYCSTTLGNTWEKFGRALPNTLIYDLWHVTKNILIAGTHGRGAWKTKLPKIDLDLDLTVKWFPWMLWVPPPPPWFFEWWKSQLSGKLGTDNVRTFHAGKTDTNIHLGRKAGQSISAPGEFEHMKGKNKKNQRSAK
jgi:hypothetical protein